MNDTSPSSKASLYRPEATARRARSIYGDIVLRGSMSSWVITALLAGIVMGGALFGILAQVDGQPILSWMLEQVH